MRFNQNPDNPVDDEHFFQATYRTGIQVEKKKALKQVKEVMRITTAAPAKEGEKEGQNKGNSDNTRKVKENSEPRHRETRGTEKKDNWYGQQGSRPMKDAALKGVPDKERKEYR